MAAGYRRLCIAGYCGSIGACNWWASKSMSSKPSAWLCLRGLGINSSWLYVMEFFGWRRFRNRKQVGSLAGLTPMPYQSGGTRREQGISKAGNRLVRAVTVEIAWGWLRFQPTSKLSRWYQERFGHGGRRARKIGIVALARKLLVELWKYLETGVIPEGAVLKA